MPEHRREWRLVGFGKRLAGGFVLIVASVAAAQTPLPPELNRALDATYPGWRLARGPGLPAERQWIRGDFDGNGRADYAIQIVRSPQDRGVKDEERQIVVVIWSGQSGQSTIAHASAIDEVTHLALARRGERVLDLDADENGTRTRKLARDAIHILYGEVAGMTCSWMANQRRFDCWTSGD
jgi:Mrp family chromosome partitioning ATPase